MDEDCVGNAKITITESKIEIVCENGGHLIWYDFPKLSIINGKSVIDGILEKFAIILHLIMECCAQLEPNTYKTLLFQGLLKSTAEWLVQNLQTFPNSGVVDPGQLGGLSWTNLPLNLHRIGPDKEDVHIGKRITLVHFYLRTALFWGNTDLTKINQLISTILKMYLVCLIAINHTSKANVSTFESIWRAMFSIELTQMQIMTGEIKAPDFDIIKNTPELDEDNYEFPEFVGEENE